jgi:hypothetical protein
MQQKACTIIEYRQCETRTGGELSLLPPDKDDSREARVFGGCHNLSNEAHNNREFLRIVMDDCPVLAVQSSCHCCELH